MSLSKKTLIRCAFLATLLVAGCMAAVAQTRQSAREHIWLGEYQEAENDYKALLKKEPANLELVLQYTSVLLALQKKDEALALLDQQKPGSEWSTLIAHRAQLLKGTVSEETQKVLARELRSKVKDASFMTALGESYLYASTDANQVEKNLNAALDVSNNRFEALMNLGTAYERLRNFGEAITHYEMAVKVKTDSALPLIKIARIYKASHNNELFVHHLEEAITAAPAHPIAYRELGDYYYSQKKYTEAKNQYEKYRQYGVLSPEDKLQYVNIMFFTKDYPGTISAANDILKEDPTRFYLLRLLGYAYYESGNQQLAAHNLKSFLEKAPNEKKLASDFEYMGDIYKKDGQDSLAILNYEQAVQVEEGDGHLYAKLAETSFKARKYDLAAKYYQLKINKMPQQQVTAQEYFELGRALFSGKRYESADSAFAMIVKMRPDAVTGHLWRAKANAKLEPDVEKDPAAKETYGKAKPFFDDFVKIATATSENAGKYKKDLIEAYSYLAFYYFFKEDDDNALVQLNKTLELDPANTYALELKKNIEESKKGKR